MSLLGRLHDALLPPRCRIERIGTARIAYAPRHALLVRAYYLYVVGLFRQALARQDVPLNLLFGHYAVDFGNDRATRRVELQFEHTLVKPGGRDSEGALPGRVPIADGDGGSCYLVRIAQLDYLAGCDLVIDYSQANLRNIEGAAALAAYRRKTVVLAPLLYAAEFAARRADDALISLFFDTRQPRRQAFLAAARQAGLPLRNVRGVFAPLALQRLYRRSRILVNVHQTDHHHTLEELRVLPALLCGVIVISEDVPLRECVPYHEFIVWSSYRDLPQAISRVHENYAQEHARIFGDPRLKRILVALHEANVATVAAALTQLSGDA